MMLQRHLLGRPFTQHRVSVRQSPLGLAPARARQGSTEENSSSRRRTSSSSKGPSLPDETPAVQLANSIAEQREPAVETPAVQLANSIAEQQEPAPSTPAVELANKQYEDRRQQQQPPGTRNPASGQGSVRTPADLLNDGIRAAASTAQEAVARSAESAQEGIALASSLTTQGITAAQSAADETVTNLASAAEQRLTQGIAAGEQILTGAATAVGGAAGAVDGVASAARTGSGRTSSADKGSGGAATLTGSFDSVNVRVPANMAWANPNPTRGPIRDLTKTQDFDEDEVEGIKVNILAAVASLDRGLAANLREASEVDRLCQQLETAAGPVTLKWSTSRSSPDTSTMDKLAGTWRLIYSSGFNGGSLGGSRPGPPAAFVPSILGQVYQVIDADKMLLDNVVELLLAYGSPQLSNVLPFLPRPDPQPTPGVRLTLRHTYEMSQPNTVTIVFESTAARAIGPDLLQGLPQFDVPSLPDFLKPPRSLRSASFDVSYLDASMRVTRGDRGELRIYLKDKPLEASAPADYVD